MKNTKTILKAILSLSVVLVLASCGNSSRIKERPPVALEVSFGLGFQQVLDEVIVNNCLECHSAYSNYQVAAQLAPKMLETVLSGRMPKGKPQLSAELQGVLQSWVNDGAPEVAGGEEAKDLPLEATYDSLMVKFFAPKCLACHSGDSNAPGPTDMNFSTYEDLLASAAKYEARNGFPLFDTEAPEDSDFAFILTDTGEGGEPMPPRSLPGDPSYVSPGDATNEEVAVIIEWMRKGLPKE